MAAGHPSRGSSSCGADRGGRGELANRDLHSVAVSVHVPGGSPKVAVEHLLRVALGIAQRKVEPKDWD